MNLDKHIACHECDLLHERRRLMDGHSALCQRCGSTLYSEKSDMLNRALALNIAALMLYIIAISLPFLGIEANGIRTEINLFHSVNALYDQDMRFISIVVCFVLLIAPALRILGMLAILIPLNLNRLRIHSPWIFRIVDLAGPWNMVEVFLIGVVVTIVKLGGIATIFLGISFWAFVAMVIVITISDLCVDRYRLWDHLETRFNYYER